jgi:hypothetical protein
VDLQDSDVDVMSAQEVVDDFKTSSLAEFPFHGRAFECAPQAPPERRRYVSPHPDSGNRHDRIPRAPGHLPGDIAVQAPRADLPGSGRADAPASHVLNHVLNDLESKRFRGST